MSFTGSAVTVNLFLPSGKYIPSNLREYSPAETGKEISNDELNHSSSPGDAIPDIVMVSPGLATSGVTVNTVTLALAPGITILLPSIQNNARQVARSLFLLLILTITTRADQLNCRYPVIINLSICINKTRAIDETSVHSCMILFMDYLWIRPSRYIIRIFMIF